MSLELPLSSGTEKTLRESFAEAFALEKLCRLPCMEQSKAKLKSKFAVLLFMGTWEQVEQG